MEQVLSIAQDITTIAMAFVSLVLVLIVVYIVVLLRKAQSLITSMQQKYQVVSELISSPLRAMMRLLDDDPKAS
jgi:uncharacterized protein YoxC